MSKKRGNKKNVDPDDFEDEPKITAETVTESKLKQSKKGKNSKKK